STTPGTSPPPTAPVPATCSATRARARAEKMGDVRTLGRRIPKPVLLRLPRRWAVPVLPARGWPRACTRDALEVRVPEPFRLEAYWLVIDGQEGPAVSLFHEDDEILRVDCLPVRPHVHYNLAEARHRGAVEDRVYIPEAPPDELIDRATFEVAHNVAH